MATWNIVLLVCLGLAVPMLGILAAIAIPTYQDYVARSKVMHAMASVEPVRQVVESRLASNAGCPGNGTDVIRAPDGYAHAGAARVVVGANAAGHCTYDIELGIGMAAIDGKHVRFERVTGDKGVRWVCWSDLPNRHLPYACQGS